MQATRPARLPDEDTQLLAVDRSFITDRVYRIAGTSWSFNLEDVAVGPPIYKEFPLEGEPGEGREWESVLVAEVAGEVMGFAAFSHERWNRRTQIWHLYLTSSVRRRGVGRALVLNIFADARKAGTRCVWLETSTVAYQAIQFYKSLGFESSGLDTSLYDPVGSLHGATALCFARCLHGGDGRG